MSGLRAEHRLIADWISSGARVLDLGCGNGEFLEALAAEKGVTGYGIEIDTDMLVKGVRDALSGADAALTQDEMRATLTAVQQRAMQAAQAKRKEEAAKNLEKGKAFLTENGAREGVTTTASGLQYEVLQAGSGPRPEPKSQVTVHYRGTLIDGTEFDSSYSRNQPATFQLDKVILGWTEGVQLMPVGSKFMFYIPSDLAYGPNGGGPIGPNATLIFEIELLEIL